MNILIGLSFYVLVLLKAYQPLSAARAEDGRTVIDEPIDTLKPQDIVEEEELERISGLLQRDNLVRGLGIVEHVYRLLHCTPGTMSMQAARHEKYHAVCILCNLAM